MYKQQVKGGFSVPCPWEWPIAMTKIKEYMQIGFFHYTFSYWRTMRCLNTIPGKGYCTLKEKHNNLLPVVIQHRVAEHRAAQSYSSKGTELPSNLYLCGCIGTKRCLVNNNTIIYIYTTIIILLIIVCILFVSWGLIVVRHCFWACNPLNICNSFIHFTAV